MRWIQRHRRVVVGQRDSLAVQRLPLRRIEPKGVRSNGSEWALQRAAHLDTRSAAAGSASSGHANRSKRSNLWNLLDLLSHPLEIDGAPSRSGDDDELGQLVRMELSKPLLECGQRVAGRLDHELTLTVALDRSLPSINRHHGRMDVDAGGQALINESARDLLGRVVTRRSRRR